ncbi:NUDIX domain-containing protein [Janibacter limosus]|uniref:NUDIX domain-containing protein n=1 Tax=Janibacter limosus TaxID=53458 RepID=UPI00082AF7C8|nr:NUDIX hydrolase [Janibacter limosus]
MTSGPDVLRDELVTPSVTSSDVVFDGAVWDVRRDTFDLEGQTLVREVVDHPGAVAVLALDEHEDALLIRQYRHPVAAHEWEIPAGLLDIEGEDPLLAAQRELLEEADVTADHWAVLVDYFTSPGGMDEAIRVYLARGLRPVPDAERHERDGEEAHIVQRRVSLDDVAAGVLAGDLHNSTLIIAALAARSARAGEWSSLRPADSPWPAHPGRRTSS